MAATLKDIAERVGVTPATVSMVLNNRPNIGKETRQKVLKVAKQLNYYPHATARGLATKRSFVIGVVVPNMAYHFVAQVLLGIEVLFVERGRFGGRGIPGDRHIVQYQLIIFDSVVRFGFLDQISLSVLIDIVGAAASGHVVQIRGDHQ